MASSRPHQRRPPPSFDHSTEPSTAVFPDTHHLQITTAAGVFAWTGKITADGGGLVRLFKSGSGGIVAAKMTGGNDGALLAVADKEVVVLHDLQRGMERSWKLKGGEGDLRLLLSAPSPPSLLYTTSLTSTIQTYSLQSSSVTTPALAHAHPSPPTVMALSATSHLLLSASAKPPTIFLQNIAMGTAPVMIAPSKSDARVVAAAWHPQRKETFALGFADGMLAVYNATTVLTSTRKDRTALVHGGEVGWVKSGHLGLTALTFLPGSKARLVSVGSDGRCIVSSLEERGNGAILHNWHVKAPATCVAAKREDLPPERSRKARSCLIAIGRVDGKVVIYKTEGQKIGQQDADTDGGRVIDVEWIEGTPDVPITKSKEGMLGEISNIQNTDRSDVSSLGTPRKGERKGLDKVEHGTPSATKSQVIEGPKAPTTDDVRAPSSVQKNPKATYLPSSGMVHNYMSLFSPIKTRSPHSRENRQKSISSGRKPTPKRNGSLEEKEKAATPRTLKGGGVPIERYKLLAAEADAKQTSAAKVKIEVEERSTPKVKKQLDGKSGRSTSNTLSLLGPYLERQNVLRATTNPSAKPRGGQKLMKSASDSKASDPDMDMQEDIWLTETEDLHQTRSSSSGSSDSSTVRILKRDQKGRKNRTPKRKKSVTFRLSPASKYQENLVEPAKLEAPSLEGMARDLASDKSKHRPPTPGKTSVRAFTVYSPEKENDIATDSDDDFPQVLSKSPSLRALVPTPLNTQRNKKNDVNNSSPLKSCTSCSCSCHCRSCSCADEALVSLRDQLRKEFMADIVALRSEVWELRKVIGERDVASRL